MLRKRIFIILIFVLGYCCFQNVVYSNNRAIVYLESNQETVEQGNEIEIRVKIENEKMAACNFSIYFDCSKLDFMPNSNNADFMGNINLINNRINFVWFDSQGGNGAKEGDIAVFKFRAKEKGLTTFTIEGEFYGQNGQLLATDFKETQIQIGKEESNLQKQAQEELPNNQTANLENANSNLQVLRLDIEGLVPQFDKDVTEYYLTIPSSIQNLEVLAIAENSNAMVEIKGNTNLQDGLNDITVEVTSSDKLQSKIYTIHVTRTANLELANTNLEMLAVENILLNPPFDVTTTFYKIEVSNETDSLNVLAVPESEQAIVEITGKENLQEGNNLVIATVTAPNGFTKKVYKIEAYKRNLEEEKAHQEEQAKRKEDLENAYKIEQTSSEINNLQQQVTKDQNKKYQGVFAWYVIIGVVVLGMVGVVWRIKKKQ